MIHLEGVGKRFAGHPAVSDLTLHVGQGEVFGLLGHNGAGKSTTIGMLLGQVWPDQGTLRIAGHDVFSARRRALARVGAIFETPAFYEELSGWRNLHILSSYTGPTPESRLREVIDWVGLSGREHRRVRTYSHGMRARLALAQALLPDPDLLILDEPTNGLDPEGIHEMRETVRRLHRELGLTLLLSSHLLVEVEQLCTRIAVLHRGRKVFEGPVAEARSGAGWVRLVTDDLAAATADLTRAGWVQDCRPDGALQPAPGVTVSDLVRHLVAGGHPVHGIGPEERTLERFYLDLVRRESETPRERMEGR